MRYSAIAVAVMIVVFAVVYGGGKCNKTYAPDSGQVQQVLKVDNPGDSVTIQEQARAISNINFGITQKSFDTAKKSFLKVTEFDKWKDLNITGHKIGEYIFDNIHGAFNNDSLYLIEIRGDLINYKSYDRDMNDQFDALMSVLTTKYNVPDLMLGLPNWTSLEEGYQKKCAVWAIGDKEIKVIVSARGTYYTLDLLIYKPKIVDKIRQDTDRKLKESSKKGAEVL